MDQICWLLFLLTMITKKEKLVNQLMTCIFRSKDDHSVIRIDFFNVLKLLDNNELVVPPKQFEDSLSQLLKSHIEGKALADKPTVYAIACIIYDLAITLNIDDNKLINFMTTAENSGLVGKTPEQLEQIIDDWRKEYYGSMSNSDKKHLIESLEGRAHPRLLDKIRRT